VTGNRRRGASATWLAGAILVLAIALPAGANAAWSPPTSLTGPDANTEFPTVAANANGNVVAAWYDGGDDPHQLIARLSADGGRTWGPQQELGSAILGSGSARPAMIRAAVGAKGKATVVWQQRRGDDQRVVAAQSHGARFGDAFAVSRSGTDAMYPDVAIAGSGRAAVVWVTPSRVQRAVISRQDSIAKRGTIAEPPLPDQPTLAANRSGHLLFAWTSTTMTNPPKTTLQVARGGARGRIGKVRELSGDGADLPQVALSRGALGTVAWEQADGLDQPVVEAASAARGEEFRSPQQLSVKGQLAILGGSGAASRGVGIDGSGHVSAVWVEVPPPGTKGTSRAKVATSDPAGRFEPATTLQTAGGAFQYERPAIAVAPRGGTVATWTRYSIDHSLVWGSARAEPSGAFGRPAAVSPDPGDASAVASTSRGGDAVAVWSLGRAAASVQAARYVAR
jgi:hypothetical protein